MGAQPLTHLIEDVRAAVADVRLQLLQPPTRWDEESVNRLRQAIQNFHAAHGSVCTHPVPPEEKEALRKQLERLAQEAARGASLARAGAEHTGAWLGWLAMHFQGYGINGEVTAMPVTGRMELQG
jgi:hypothetical protein